VVALDARHPGRDAAPRAAPDGQHGATAKAAASDWGGDRVGLYRGPDGAWAIVLATAWDTPAAAARFRPAADKVAAGLPHARVVDGAQGPALVVGSDPAVLDEVATLSL